MKSMQYLSDSSGRIPGANRGSLGASTANKPAETANFDQLIGKKVWTRWPEDNSFYEAVITDYDPAKVTTKCPYLTVNGLIVMNILLTQPFCHW